MLKDSTRVTIIEQWVRTRSKERMDIEKNKIDFSDFIKNYSWDRLTDEEKDYVKYCKNNCISDYLNYKQYDEDIDIGVTKGMVNNLVYFMGHYSLRFDDPIENDCIDVPPFKITIKRDVLDFDDIEWQKESKYKIERDNFIKKQIVLCNELLRKYRILKNTLSFNKHMTLGSIKKYYPELW